MSSASTSTTALDVTTSAQADNILLRHDAQGITTLSLNQADQFNVLSMQMLDLLIRELESIKQDPSVRVLIIQAEGKAFCSGHNLKQMRQNPEHQYQLELFTRCGQFMQALLALPQPVIAKVHGIATAAGCQLVAMCDLAIASEHAKFAVSGINVGLFCSTPAVALSRNVGRKKAFEMLVTGEFISAQQAQEWGLINHCVAAADLDPTVQELALKLCRKPAGSLAMGKQLFYEQLEQPISQAYAQAAQVMADNMMLADTQEGLDAFMQKRVPSWAQAAS
ncbi:MAG: enoyl-CoA hydratase [Pelistega sp.]|nr:enoyl-CoA hydratase [Pelistega sp.]